MRGNILSAPLAIVLAVLYCSGVFYGLIWSVHRFVFYKAYKYGTKPLLLYWLSAAYALGTLSVFLFVMRFMELLGCLLTFFLVILGVVAWVNYAISWLQASPESEIEFNPEIKVPQPKRRVIHFLPRRRNLQFWFQDLIIALFWMGLGMALVVPYTQGSDMKPYHLPIGLGYLFITSGFGFWIAIDIFRRMSKPLDAFNRAQHFSLIFLSLVIFFPIGWVAWRVMLIVLRDFNAEFPKRAPLVLLDGGAPPADQAKTESDPPVPPINPPTVQP